MSQPLPEAPIATAVPVKQDSVNLSTSNLVSDGTVSKLAEMGYPRGLVKEMGNSRSSFPIRYWILDDSSSMNTPDGKYLRTVQGQMTSINCSRWKELQMTVHYHAELAGIIGANTSFRLMNRFHQEFTIANSMEKVEDDVLQAQRWISQARPCGTTPMIEHIMLLYSRISEIEAELRANDQKVACIFVADGLPTDARGLTHGAFIAIFIAALQRLQTLPVWIVFRICSDDDAILNFYSELDKVLEFPIDVLDDQKAEAKEIFAYNPWLNYTLQLHRVREMGYYHRLFDFLDERPLSKDEAHEFLVLLFGEESFRDTDYYEDWDGYVRVVEKLVTVQPNEYNPKTKKSQPWIDIKRFNKTYKPRRSLFGRRKN